MNFHIPITFVDGVFGFAMFVAANFPFSQLSCKPASSSARLPLYLSSRVQTFPSRILRLRYQILDQSCPRRLHRNGEVAGESIPPLARHRCRSKEARYFTLHQCLCSIGGESFSCRRQSDDLSIGPLVAERFADLDGQGYLEVVQDSDRLQIRNRQRQMEFVLRGEVHHANAEGLVLGAPLSPGARASVYTPRAQRRFNLLSQAHGCDHILVDEDFSLEHLLRLSSF
jgi:hypothetical protein